MVNANGRRYVVFNMKFSFALRPALHFSLSVTLMTTAFSSCAHQAHEHKGHEFKNAEAWATAFEDPNRDVWQKPDVVIDTLALPSEALVADVGAATGYFAVRIAKARPKGKVYGIDVESAMVDYLSARAAKEGLSNLDVVLASFDDAKIPRPVDVVLIVNTYHHLQNRVAYFERLKKSLKPNGRVAIIDFTMNSSLGPRAEMKVSPDTAMAELERAGFRLKAKHESLPEQYFLEFQQ
jgi:cyclopropane fatty-acyl-phospholipid synthase-like methyltransferase